MVSAKLGIPFAARSTNVRGLNNDDVLRNSKLSASVKLEKSGPRSTWTRSTLRTISFRRSKCRIMNR